MIEEFRVLLLRFPVFFLADSPHVAGRHAARCTLGLHGTAPLHLACTHMQSSKGSLQSASVMHCLSSPPRLPAGARAAPEAGCSAFGGVDSNAVHRVRAARTAALSCLQGAREAA